MSTMKRRRGGAKSTSRSPELSKQATSPETRLRRPSTRGASLTPSKPARRHPTEALHMTTRAAANAGSTASSDSTLSTSEASGSRRSSLNDDDHRRLAHDAGINHDQHASNRTGESDSTEADRSQHRHADPESMHADAPQVADSQASSQASPEIAKSGNKRKRSSSGDDVREAQPHTNGVTNGASPQKVGDAAATQKPPPAYMPPRKRAYRGRGRGRGGRQLTLSTHSSFAGTSTPGSALPSPDKEAADQGSEGDRPAKQQKRLPGRRRAPNSNPSIEADLRRQLQLKTAYRAVVKVLKPVLAELADRAINDVEDDPTAHQQSEQYEVVKQALDAKLAERLAHLDRKLHIAKGHVERRKNAEVDIAKEEFELVFDHLKEDHMVRCQHQLLELAREADARQDPDATDDEDGLVPRRRGMQYKWRSTGFLDPSSDSRSRFFLETDKLWSRSEVRQNTKKQRGEFLKKHREDFDEQAVNTREGFATFDADRREYALAVFNAGTLARAAHSVEHEGATPVVKALPNEDATGLQLLASAIENLPLPSQVQESVPPAFESNFSRFESVPSRSTSTPKPGRGRGRRGASAKSTPSRAPARSITATPVPFGPDESFEPVEPGSAMSAAMSLDTETRDPSPLKTAAESTPAEPMIEDEPLPLATWSPFMNGEKERSVTEAEPRLSGANRITDLLNKGDEPAMHRTPTISSSPVPLPFAALQALTTSRLSNQPTESSEPARTSQRATPSEIDMRADTTAPTQERSSAAPAASSQEAPANPARKNFWDTITIGNKSRPISPPNADKTPLARIRQILNPSNFPRKASETTATSPASSSADRPSERPEMAPPAARTSVSNEASSRRSSGAASVISQSGSAPPMMRSPVDAPKRSSSRDTGLEQRQNRWRAAVPPQHGPTPPFRPNSNPPQNAFLKHQGWTAESQARQPAPPSTTLPHTYTSYAPPYDARSRPPPSYQPPPPPPSGPYSHGPPPPNPYLTAVPQVPPPFPCPPGPPPYQSIYSPPAGWPQQSGFGPPPPPPPPPSHQQQGPPPPPPPPHQQQSHYGTQYGGQPILPASVDRRQSVSQGQSQGAPYPGSPHQHPLPHPPAFSQPQQYGSGGAHGQHGQQGERRGGGGGSGGGRRRWKHHQPGTEFRPYTGPKRH